MSDASWREGQSDATGQSHVGPSFPKMLRGQDRPIDTALGPNPMGPSTQAAGVPWIMDGNAPVAFARGPGLRALQFGNKTLILHVRRFNGGNMDNILWGAQFLTEVVAYVRQNNLTQAIVDVSSNRGGDLCWGYILAKYIASISDNRLLQFPTRITRAPLFFQLASTGINRTTTSSVMATWIPENYRHIPYLNPYKDASWMYNQVVDTCLLDVLAGLPPFPIPRSKILVTSNGDCMDVCSVFASTLTSAKPVTAGNTIRSVSVGLVPISSGAGGKRMTYSLLQADASLLGVSETLSCPLNPLPVQGDLSFLIREVLLSRESRIPLEYCYNSPSQSIPHSPANLFSMTNQWKDAVSLMFGSG
mmetsp:Transcript_4806/g.7469  ORF Transcript_4806/g.7469 Transcript_4806/m.7469 type:complete len:361 (-) Transcript_4806:365-1447(-)